MKVNRRLRVEGRGAMASHGLPGTSDSAIHVSPSSTIQGVAPGHASSLGGRRLLVVVVKKGQQAKVIKRVVIVRNAAPKDKVAQGSTMQRAAPPYIPGSWAPHPHNELGPPAAPGLKPHSSTPSLMSQPLPPIGMLGANMDRHVSNLPYTWNPGRPQATAMDAYMQMLQNMSGPHGLKSLDTPPLHGSTPLGSTYRSNADLKSSSQSQNGFYETHHPNPLNMQAGVLPHMGSDMNIHAKLHKETEILREKLSAYQPTVSDSLARAKYPDLNTSKVKHTDMSKHASSSHSSIPPASFSPTYNNVTSHKEHQPFLKWKTAHLPKSTAAAPLDNTYNHSTAATSVGLHAHDMGLGTTVNSSYPGHVSTSNKGAEMSQPATSNSHMISHFSEPREPREYYQVPNGLSNNKANIEAARIVAESQHSNMALKNDIHGSHIQGSKLDNQFANISKDYHRQQKSPFQPSDNLCHAPMYPRMPTRPGSTHSSHSLELPSPGDYRPENILHRQLEQTLPARPETGQHETNMWSPYGQPMPSDMHASQRLNNYPQQTMEHIKPPPKKQKIHHRVDDFTESAAADTAALKEMVEKRRSPKVNCNRHGSFTADPEIDAIVSANVQQIMAACKQTNEDPGLQSSNTQHSEPQTSKFAISASNASMPHQQPFDLSMSQSGHGTPPSAAHLGYHGQHQANLAQQVMDMRMEKKEAAHKAMPVVGQPQNSQEHMLPQQQQQHPIHGTGSTVHQQPMHATPSQGMSMYEQINEVRAMKNEVRAMKKQHELELQTQQTRPDLMMNHAAGNQPARPLSSLSDQVNEIRQQKQAYHRGSSSQPGNAAPDYHSIKGVNNYPRPTEVTGSQDYMRGGEMAMYTKGPEMSAKYSRPHEGTGFSKENEMVARQNMPVACGVMNERAQGFPMNSESQPQTGSQPPCCGNCERLGVRNSPSCQRNKMRLYTGSHGLEMEKPVTAANDARSKVSDPYNFMDDVNVSKHVYKPHKFANSAMKENKYDRNAFDMKRESDLFLSRYEEGIKREPSTHYPVKHESMTDTKRENNELYLESARLQAYRNSLQKPNMQYPQQSMLRDVLKTERMPPKAKFNSGMKIEKAQGFSATKKALNNKPYGIKSSNALLKRSYKYYQGKTPSYQVKAPTVRQKWRSNPKYKKKVKDDFAEKLMKNLGYPPLTLQDLMDKKKNLKLRKGYYNGHSTIASSVLSAENKTDCRDRVSPAESVTVPCQENELQITSKPAETFIKPLYRSRSVDLSKSCDLNGSFARPRSCSVMDQMKESQKPESAKLPTEVPVMVTADNQQPVEYSQAEMAAVSQQINDLRAKVTSNPDLNSNSVVEVPKCACLGFDAVFNEAVEGPYYTHLGTGRSVEAIRTLLEKRFCLTGSALRIEKVRYTGKEGKSTLGCPIAKWIIRRSSSDEKYLAVLRHRERHKCDTAWIVIAIVAWEGVPTPKADELYSFLSATLPKYGNETERRCGTNDRKTCACQGADILRRGASFSFGCSWSMYFNGCKFARSTHARKFRLKSEDKEEVLENKLQDLATYMGPLYQKCAPQAHSNQSYFSEKAPDCRLGRAGPFSGVTACVDFCAHAHKDIHNMNNGSTVVVTLTKHRGLSKPDDEQLHVLPLYVLDPTDEGGSYQAQFDKIKSGSLEVLHQYPLEARLRAQPLESCKKRRAAKRAGKKAGLNGYQAGWDSSSSAQSTPQKKHDNAYFNSPSESNKSASSVAGSTESTPVKQNGIQQVDWSSNKPITYDNLMSLSSRAGFKSLYDKFWSFYSNYGVFPPAAYLAKNNGQHSRFDTSQITSSTYSQGQAGQQQQQQPLRSNINPQQQQQSGHHSNRPDQSYTVPLNSNSAPVAGGQRQHDTARPHESVVIQDPFSDSMTGQAHKPPPSTNSVNVSDKTDITSQNGVGENVNKHPYGTETSKSASEHYWQGGPSLPKQHSDQNAQPAMTQNTYSSEQSQDSKKHPLEGCALDLSCSSSSSIGSNQERGIQRNESSAGETGAMPGGTSSSLPPASSTHTSPLDLLSRTVDMHSKDIGFTGQKPAAPTSGLHGQQSTMLGQQPQSHNQQAIHGHGFPGHPPHSHQQAHLNSLPGHPAAHGQPTSSANSVAGFPGKMAAHANDLPPQASSNHVSQGSHQPQQHPSAHISSQHPQYQGHAAYSGNMPAAHTDNNQPRNTLENQHNPSNIPRHPGTAEQHAGNMMGGQQFQRPGAGVDGSSGTQEGQPSMLDPDIVKCEMEYNEGAFCDPDIGGVAIALCHGAVLFEVAKRELHATTGLRNPNRYHPTRISLVFYQHKSLNNPKHGMYAYEKKLDDMKMKRIEQMQLDRGFVNMKEIEDSFKGGKKRKIAYDDSRDEAEIAHLLERSQVEYRYMVQCNTGCVDSTTTNTMSTKWIDPSPSVTGPYQKWV